MHFKPFTIANLVLIYNLRLLINLVTNWWTQISRFVNDTPEFPMLLQSTLSRLMRSKTFCAQLLDIFDFLQTARAFTLGILEGYLLSIIEALDYELLILPQNLLFLIRIAHTEIL